MELGSVTVHQYSDASCSTELYAPYTLVLGQSVVQIVDTSLSSTMVLDCVSGLVDLPLPSNDQYATYM